ncbi:MAG: PP2C family protein-serine/threonine phosphatase [Planctomycetes bacterium]|nr:PP2C family protein-serine/threonine phosphatase [Planctomycetota bacterium]
MATRRRPPRESKSGGRSTPPRRPSARAQQAPPAAEDEALLHDDGAQGAELVEDAVSGLDETEEVITAENLDDVPGSPAEESKRRSSGTRRSSGNSGRNRAGRGSGSIEKPSRQPGAEIGRLHRRGLSLAVKFSLFISLLIILISALFGLVVIRIFQEKLRDDILRSGYQQALTLRAFGRRVYDRFVQFDKDEDKSRTAKYFHETAEGQSDQLLLQKIVEGDPRVQDIAIFASREPLAEPRGRVVIARSAESFSPYADEYRLDIPIEGGADPEIVAYQGRYNNQRSIFFRASIEGKGKQLYATANLILSEEQVQMEVSRLLTKIALFGLVFVGAGIALSLGLASAVTSPINVLVRDMDIVARGDLEHETRPQTNDEIGLLAMAFNRMTQSLKDARQQEREVERLNSELDLAKEIHAQLMPKKLPNLPGYDIFTGYYCAKEVGGDYYDFIPIDQEHLAMVIADVSGKSIPGSMVMSWTRTILRMMAPMNSSPADVMSKTNYHVAREIKRGMFVTCQYAILNVRTRDMTIASAGHNPMIIYRAQTNECELIRPNGIALGFDKGPIFDRTIREKQVKLFKGDRVVMYTDGIPESMNPNREEWGDENLVRFCKEYANLSSKEFVRLLVQTLEHHQGSAEQHDDITVTTFRIV